MMDWLDAASDWNGRVERRDVRVVGAAGVADVGRVADVGGVAGAGGVAGVAGAVGVAGGRGQG